MVLLLRRALVLTAYVAVAGIGSLTVIPSGVVLHGGRIPSFTVTRLQGAGPAAAQSPVVRTVQLDLYPSVVLVDAATRRVFVFARTNPYAPHQPEVAALKVLDAATGALLHTTPLGHNTYFDGAVVDPRGGHVLLVTHTTRRPSGLSDRSDIRVLDGRTGAVVQVFSTGRALRAIAIDVVRQQAFLLDAGTLDELGAPTGNAILRDVDAATGRVIRLIRLNQLGQNGGALIVDGQTRRVFVAESGGVRVLDEATGATVSRVPLSSRQTVLGLALDERAGRVVVGVRFDVERMEAVTLLDAGTGKVVRGAIGAGEALAVDTTDGRIVAAFTLTPSSGGDVGAQVVDIISGRVVSAPTLATGASFQVASAVDEPRRRAIVVIAEGTSGPNVANVLDTYNGRVVRQLSLGIGAPAVGVDAQTQRAFVANGGDTTVSVLDTTRL